MKAQTIFLILLSCLVFSACRSKVKHTFKEDYKQQSEVTTDTNQVVAYEQALETTTLVKKDTIEKVKESSGSVKIVGEVDSLNPFDYYNIINGDTLARIGVIGNARIEINQNWNNKEKESSVKEETNTLNIVQEVARESVAAATISNVAESVKSTKKEAKEKGFTFSAWMTMIIIFAILLVAIYLYFYMGGAVATIKNKILSWIKRTQ